MESASTHGSLRQEWVEIPPDVSYRFVVGVGTVRAAQAAVIIANRKELRWWQRGLVFLVGLIRRLVGFVLKYVVTFAVLGFMAWLSFQAATLIDDLIEGSARPYGNAILGLTTIVIFLVAYFVLIFKSRRLRKIPLALYNDYFAGNEFLLEGRQSFVWFEERSAGAIRRWSTFDRVVEFDEGMWLSLRRGRNFTGLRGLLISKENFPGSCGWDELRTYVKQHIEEATNDKTPAK